MTITVTVNSVGIRNTWRAPGTGAPGVPLGAITFQSPPDGIAVGASTAEDTVISINCGLAIGWTYRLVEARVHMAVALVNADRWGNSALGNIIMANPSNPAQDQLIPFELSTGQPGQVGVPTDPPQVDGSSLPFAITYGPLVPLPNIPLSARSATSVIRLFLASAPDTLLASELRFYLRVLVYTIADDEQWAIHSPVPVTF